MRRLTGFVVSLGVLSGCGGAVSKADGAGSSTSNGGAPTGSAAAGDANGGSTTRGGATSEPVGDPTDPRYPALPPDAGGAFYWRHGLGNWFVAKSDGTTHDATLENDGGSVSWTAEGASMQSLDLWAQLNHPAGRAVDLSPYSGVSFDAELTGANAQLVLVFNASGKYQAAISALDAQRFSVTSDWQTFELRFSDIGYTADATSSFDFIVTSPDAPFVLRVRNLALLCKTICP